MHTSVPAAARRARRSLAAAAAALVVLPAAVLGASPAGAVAHGDLVPQGRYRFAVKLTMTGIPTSTGGKRNSACSGALISPSWVLTAGHCFRDANGVRVSRPVADLTTATLGVADTTTAGARVLKVVAVKQAPGSTDIALVRLAASSATIPRLLLSNRVPQVGDVVRLAGFGATSSVAPTPSTRLRTGQFTVRGVQPTFVALTGRTPFRDTSPCLYDSGAPFFRETSTGAFAVSVESDGPGCPTTGNQTTARVDTVLSWIRTTVAGG